ncbi:MAG TPA: glycoside hydrolase family 3 C-terminal domain-containing protein [Candidatus Methylacidiphilales bacterium]
MKFIIVSLLLVLPITTLHADETALSSGGKTFLILGDIEHVRLRGHARIEGATDDSYKEEIEGAAITAKVEGLPAGTYTAELDLDETDKPNKGPGLRVMRISSGQAVLADNLYIFAVAGFEKAYPLKVNIVHQDDTILGPLAITFTGIKGKAKFNAIRILDGQGTCVASVKACDLVEMDDAFSLKIPKISDPIIYMDPDQSMDARIDDLIRRMSLSEKVKQLMNAAPANLRLNIPEYDYSNECLHGVANNGKATIFPQAIGMAATWDESKMHQVGEAIGIEGRAKYYQAQRDGMSASGQGLNFWSPNINIFRDPRWGRGQETYGEDPFLTARMGVNFIEGIQGNDPKYLVAMACAKHFAVHSGPERGRVNFNVDPNPRDLYETYLPQFQAAVEEAHVGGVMTSYNSIYHVPNAANSWLLTDLLRNQWGFTGYIVSDNVAVAHLYLQHHYATSPVDASADAIKAGLDLEDGNVFRALTKSVAQGLVTEKDIDKALHHVLWIRFRLGLFDPPGRDPWSKTPMTEVECPEHLALARDMACESMVLLKNDHLLPLDKNNLHTIVVVGMNAQVPLLGNYTGTPSKPITILAGIQEKVGSAVKVDYFKGAPLTQDPKNPQNDVPLADYQKSLDAAKAADVIIYVGGLNYTELESEASPYESPGFSHGDRTVIELPAVQEKLLQDLQATGKPVVFVNCSGSAIAMPWEAAHLPAILQAWYPGVQGGAAVADVLFGDYNPAGRLPVTFYGKTADLPDFSDYRMANRTYRYFKGKAVFPFGFGLSYTTFDYAPIVPRAAVATENDTLHLTVPIKNTGDRDGDEVVQVYLRHRSSSVPQPIRSLVAFKRVAVAKGDTVNVDFDIPVERFHYWSAEKQRYVVEPGADEIQIGASSSDIRQTCEVTVH